MLKNILFIMCLLTTLAPAANSFATTVFFIAPSGSDNNDGSVNNPFKSLQKALDMAYAIPDASADVEIRVKNGTYRGLQGIVTLPASVPKVSIIGEIKQGKRPVFTRGNKNRHWLRVNASHGQATKLSIKNLEIADYFSGILLWGNRDHIQTGNSGTQIENNVFRRIGSTAKTSNGLISTGVVVFVNSSNNLVKNNRFQDIKNETSCGGLHALYIAHFSSDNRITDNLFKDTCGSPIKFRDRSDNNVVSDNRFEEIINAPSIEEWFCDKDARKDCTKKLGECPSIGNQVNDNIFANEQKKPKQEIIKINGKNIPRSWCKQQQFVAPRFS